MSKNYYTANQPFHLTENRIKQIIQTQIQQFFLAIKDEIELKIKQIDLNIISLKDQIRIVQKQNKEKYNQSKILLQKIGEMNRKIEEIKLYRDSQIQKIRQQIRNKSYDRGHQRKQQKSPLFKKNSTNPPLDLNSLIFGEDTVKNNLSDSLQKILQQPKLKIAKPPLPKQQCQPIKQQKTKTAIISQQNNYVISAIQNMPNINNQSIMSLLHQQKQPQVPSRLVQNLNKNKNSFMRSKSSKKFSSIPEEQLQQSLMSTK